MQDKPGTRSHVLYFYWFQFTEGTSLRISRGKHKRKQIQTMPQVKSKFIVSFTSQDEHYKAANLITSDGFKKWLSHPKERSGEISVTLQLERECSISYIDIGTHWCANIEIQVGRSDWPQGVDYETLAPTCIMMTPIDCNLARNCTSTRMFSSKDFKDHVASKTWDRIRIICRQPLKKDVQFGLSFLRIKTMDTITPSKDLSSVSTNQQKTIRSIQKHFFGKTKTSETPTNEVKTKLLKMAGSSENGTEMEGAMSRTAKLVLAASAGNLRHKLERQKKRKLDKDERKTFAEMARNYICKLFGESDDEKKENSGKSREGIENIKKDNIENNSSQKKVVNSKKAKCGKTEKICYGKESNSGIEDRLNSPDRLISPVRLNTSVDREEKYGNFHLKNDFASPKSTPADEQKKSDIANQLKQIRQNAHKNYTANVDKIQSPENSTFTGTNYSSHDEGLSESGSNNKYENFAKKMVLDNEMYKNMSYLERKAFAFTNPYKANKNSNSMSFGPSKSDSGFDDESPVKNSISSPSTNDQWLSKVNPSRNDVMISPPTRGKRKRGPNAAIGGRASKVSKNSDGEIEYLSKSGTPKRGRGRGRGNTVAGKETRPTSFERCENCQ
ncbi:DNA-repair protein XRCC1, partial [Mytilus galloprovincialis]